jgi:hypothetical protein
MVMRQKRSSFPSARRSSPVRAFAVLAASLALAACGGGGDDNNDDGGGDDDPSVWHLRAVNAMRDAPVLQFYVDDTAVSTADYGSATDYEPAHTGERTLKLGARDPSDLESTETTYTDIDDNESFEFDGPTNYTIVAAGTVASPRKFVITDTSRAEVEDNTVEYQVINAAVDAGSLGVYITSPEAGLDTAEQVGVFDLGEHSARETLELEIASGDEEDDARSGGLTVEVRDGATVLYTSSRLGISEGNRLLIVVTDHLGPVGASPVKLFVVGGSAAGAAAVAYDSSDPSELRFSNLSPDAGALDLMVDTSDAFHSNVAFGGQSAYRVLGATVHDSIVTPTGNPGSFLFVNNFTTADSRSYTLHAQGPMASARGVVSVDDRRQVATEARFRFFNAAPSRPNTLDIYLTPDGEELDLDAETPPSPNAADVLYRGFSAMFALAAGSYDAYFTLANSKDVILGPVDLDVVAGSVQTLAVVDSPVGELHVLPINDARD